MNNDQSIMKGIIAQHRAVVCVYESVCMCVYDVLCCVCVYDLCVCVVCVRHVCVCVYVCVM